jgi:hypothetical protein
VVYGHNQQKALKPTTRNQGGKTMKKATLTQIGIAVLTIGLIFALTTTADAALTRNAPMDDLGRHQVVPREKVTEPAIADRELTPTTDYLYGEIEELTASPEGAVVKTASLVPWELLSCDYMGLFERYFGDLAENEG